MSLLDVDERYLRVDPEKMEKGIIPDDPIERREAYIRLVSGFTAKQRAFLTAYIHHREIKAACEAVDISESSPRDWEKAGINWRYAASLMIEDHVSVAKALIQQASVKAIQTMIDLLDSADPKIRIQAADKLSKLMGSDEPKEVKHTHTGDINVDVDYKATLMRMVEGESRALGAEEDVVEAELVEVLDNEE